MFTYSVGLLYRQYLLFFPAAVKLVKLLKYLAHLLLQSYAISTQKLVSIKELYP